MLGQVNKVMMKNNYFIEKFERRNDKLESS